MFGRECRPWLERWCGWPEENGTSATAISPKNIDLGSRKKIPVCDLQSLDGFGEQTPRESTEAYRTSARSESQQRQQCLGY